MDKLVVSEILDQIVQTKWTVEPHGSINISIDLSEPIIHNDFFYWRLDDPRGRYLLSMDISEDGYLKVIEIVAYDHRITSIPALRKNTDVIRKEGLIRIDTSVWRSRKQTWLENTENSKNMRSPHFSNNYKFIDNAERFCLQMDESDFRIELLQDTVVQEVYVSKSVCLDINNMNEICGIILKNFLGQDRETLFRNFGTKFGRFG